MADMGREKNDNLLFINGVRVLLCAMVFVSHFYYFLGGRYIHGIRVIGALGPRAVDVFFFLTGFFTFLSYEKRKMHPVRYFGHKLGRLYPEYVPALIIASLTLPLRTASQQEYLLLTTGSNIGAFGGTFTAEGFPGIRSFLVYLFFSNGIIPADIETILDVAWCLPIEVYFYLLFCIAVLLGMIIRSRGGKNIYRAAFIFSLAAGIIIRIDLGTDASQTFLRSLPVMIMGVLMAEVYMGRTAGRTVEIVMAASGLIYLFLLDISQNWISAGIIGLIMIFLIFQERFSIIKTFLSSDFFVRGAKLSFSFYLSHMMVISIVFWVLMRLSDSIMFLSAPVMCVSAFVLSVLITMGYSSCMVKTTDCLHKNIRKKKSILIFSLSRTPWIGGIYYRKNVVHMLLLNREITSKYDIVILVNAKHKGVFECFERDAAIVECSDDTGVLKAVWKAFTCCLKYRVRYVFPLMPFGFLKLFGITPVSWIADFQHCHYPEFFEQDEVSKRDRNFKKIASADNPLVLSSNDAKNDLIRYFRKDRSNVFVVHFSSFIGDELAKLDKEYETEALKRFGLEKYRYIAVCNQFWKHKNHIVILKAVRELMESDRGLDLKFVFTGEPSDRRNPDYMDEVRNLINTLEKKVDVLGFIDRKDQLCIMKYALFIIQPSLFEGWGTVVEDAKILGKRILLSDIPVHREQMNEKCTLFDPQDPKKLADAIVRMSEIPDHKDLESCDMSAVYAESMTDIFN